MKTYKVTVDDYGTTRWYNEQGKLHRENGPAIEYEDGEKWWWLNGISYSKLEWEIEVAKLNGPTQEEINKALEVLGKATGYKITKY